MIQKGVDWFRSAAPSDPHRLPLVATMLAFIVGTEEQAGTIFGFPLAVAAPVFFAFIVGALIFSFKNWRCPACDKYLGKIWNPRHCPSCGVALQ